MRRAKLLMLAGAFVLVGCQQQPAANQQNTMQLTSPAFEHNQPIPPKYTCDGEDASPPLAIAGVPVNAQSLVLIVDDPDAPGKDWVHWVAWNIPPSTREIAENNAPTGAALGTTDFGEAGWGGPCPPSGEHRYQFKLYALDALLGLGASAEKKNLEQAMEGHILDQTVLTGLYQRH